MRCHNRIGHDLDGLLCNVIRDFVAQELEHADDEEVSISAGTIYCNTH